MLVGIAPVVHRDAAVAHIFDIDVPGEQTVEFGNHAMTSTGEPADRFPADCTPWFGAGNPLAGLTSPAAPQLNNAVADCPGSTSRLLSLAARPGRTILIEDRDALLGSTGDDDCRCVSDRRPCRRRAGGRAYHRRATQHRPGRNAHPEIRSGAGRRQPTHPPVRGRHRLSGRLLFPEQHPIGFLALRAEATMCFALRGQSAGRRVRLSGQARSAAGVPQPRLTQHAPHSRDRRSRSRPADFGVTMAGKIATPALRDGQ